MLTMKNEIESRVEKNIGLVYNVWLKMFSRRYACYEDDFISHGMEGLWNAARKFDANNGTKFSTYAHISIRNAMGCFVQYLNRNKRQAALNIISTNQEDYEIEQEIHNVETKRMEDAEELRKLLADEIVADSRNGEYSPDEIRDLMVRRYCYNEPFESLMIGTRWNTKQAIHEFLNSRLKKAREA